MITLLRRKCAKIVPFLTVMGSVFLIIQISFLYSTKDVTAGQNGVDRARDVEPLQRTNDDQAGVIVKEVYLPPPKHGTMNGNSDPSLWRVQRLNEENKCLELLMGKFNSISEVQGLLQGTKGESLQAVSDDAIVSWTLDCELFKEKRGYFQQPLSNAERSYPIAYSIVVHQDAAQVERLLRAIYMPQNVYCIHIDLKASNDFMQAVVNLASCFGNVFIASKLEDVIYAGVSRLQADLNCMQDLVRSEVPWKYLINLSGQDFPLKTNYEIIQQLQTFKGLNDITGVLPNELVKQRTDFVYTVENGEMVHGRLTKPPPPHNITIYFGSAYNIFSREFLKWVLTDPVPRDFLEWTRDTYSPDEHYWVSLQRIPGVPGGYPKATWGSTARAIKWSQHEGKLYPLCAGQFVRQICVFGVGDLTWLTSQHHLFANKFDLTFDPVVVQCLEEWMKERLSRHVNWINFPHILYSENEK